MALAVTIAAAGLLPVAAPAYAPTQTVASPAGEVMSASRAAEIGLVNRVFADDVFERSVEEYVAQTASKSATAVSLAKNLLYQTDGMSFESAIEAGAQLNAITRMTEDCKRGIDKFLSKQKP